MDAVTSVAFEIQTTASPGSAVPGGQASVFEIGHYEQAASKTTDVTSQNQTVQGTQESEGFQRAIELLDSLNGGMKSIGIEASAMAGSSSELTPGQMLNITVKAHQFLFKSELTANVANRTSEGIQQLFRQQS